MRLPTIGAPSLPDDVPPPPAVRFFPGNRRDGSRLLSSALVFTVIGITAWQHPLGKVLAITAAAISLYWWLQYRQLQQ